MRLIVGKRVNKLIIGAVLGTALIGIGGYGMSPKGKGFFKRMFSKVKGGTNFFKLGLNELLKIFKKK